MSQMDATASQARKHEQIHKQKDKQSGNASIATNAQELDQKKLLHSTGVLVPRDYIYDNTDFKGKMALNFLPPTPKPYVPLDDYNRFHESNPFKNSTRYGVVNPDPIQIGAQIYPQ